jgi:hypothetical protein
MVGGSGCSVKSQGRRPVAGVDWEHSRESKFGRRWSSQRSDGWMEREELSSQGMAWESVSVKAKVRRDERDPWMQAGQEREKKRRRKGLAAFERESGR